MDMMEIIESSSDNKLNDGSNDDDDNQSMEQQTSNINQTSPCDDNDDHMKQSDNIIDDDADDDTVEKSIPIESVIIDDDDDDDRGNCEESITTTTATATTTLNDELIFLQEMNNPPNVRLSSSSMSSLQTLPIPMMKTTTIFLNSQHNDNNPFICESDDIDDQDDDNDQDNDGDQNDDNNDEDHMKFIDTNLDDLIMMDHDNNIDIGDTDNNNDDDDTDDETKTETSSFNNGQQMMNDDKKRLRLEDFMRQIITQINTSTEKIWPNLLLDFTKNFSELNIPTYVLQTSSSSTTLDDHCSSSSSFTKSDIDPSIVMMPTNSDNPSTNKMIQNNNRLVSNSDQDLLMDILNIAISSLTMEQTDRRIFACQLLLNIHDCLTMDTIETKLMPLLSELITNETTTSVRFTICFVLANYARRVEFDYFQSIIFPLFEKLSIIVLDNDNSSSSSSNQQQQNNNSLCTSTTICFALLDSLTSLLSYLLHFNQISMKKQQQQHCDNEQMPSEKEQPESNEQNTEKSTKNNVLEFIYQKFLPLLKQTFQRMLDFIDQYRSMSIKIEQDLFNCFLHWRDQIGSHDSITQTLFSHYQSLVLFILILRDYMMNNNDNHQCDNLNIDQRFLMEMFDHDHWYLDFYYRLCAFHYVLPPPPPLTPQSPSQLSSDNTLIDVSSSSSTTLIDQSTNSILTKINLMDLGKNNSNIQQQQQQNFIGRYQVTNVDGNMMNVKTLSSPSSLPLPLSSPLSTTTTTSILQQHLQQQSLNNTETLSAYNSNYNNNDNNNIQTLTNSNITTTTIQNNNDFSIGSTQYTFTSNALNNLDIFGFFRYKTISCKIILVSLIPTISDLYDIGKQQQLQQQQSIKPLHNRQLRSRKSLRLKSGQPSRLPVSVVSSVQSSNKDEDITDSVDIESNSESPLSLEIERNNHDNKDNIATRLIDILNTLSIDNNYEIAMKMSNIIEKLVERFTEPIRLYSVLTNVLQSQNFDVIAQIIRNFVDVFTSMLNSSQLTAQTNTIIEYVVDTFMRSETYLSTKPKWRLHIQYFDVMFRLSRIIPVDIVKRLIIPRLLLRFSTTRPIPCRQAIARCLLMVYLENFAQHDFEKYCVQSTAVNNGANNQTTMMMISYPLNFDDHDHDQNAYLSFDLFNWLDRNLRQSQRYQDRQLYIDMLAMFIRFLFRDSIEWRESLPNHYLMDIEEQCPSLMNWSELSYRFSKYRYHLNLKELHSSQFFAMLMIQRYRLLHQLTELATKDRVSTIRTSSCIVLFTLLQCTNYWVINHLHQIPITVNDHCITKTNMIGTRNVSDIDNNDQSQLIEIIMDYYDAYMDNNGTIISEIESSANNYNSIGYCTSEQLEIRRQLEKDRIVLEELYKLYTLIDDIRLDLNLNYYQLRNKRKKPRKQQYNDEMISSSSPTPSITSIDSSVIELINELMLTVENDYLDQMNENNDDDDDVILEPLDKSSSEEDEGIDLNNDSSELIIDDLVVSESSTLSSSSIIETTAMETVNNSTESESTKCPGLIYVANVDELIVDSNETMDSKGNTSITEAGSETSAVVVINKKVVESSWSIQGNKSFNPNSLKCSTKKRKSPKHHEQQHQQSHMNHQRSVSNLALEKHLNTIIKHSDIISNIQQPSIMMMAKTNSTNVNKSGYKGNYYHHHGINPGHNSGKVSLSASSKKKTSMINSQQRNNNNNNNGIALLPTPNNNNTVHCGSKVPILSNRNNNNNSHHHHMINNRVSLLQQQQQSSMVNNNNNNLTPNTANRNTSSSYPGFCYRIVYPTQTGQQQQSSTTTTTNSSAQFYNSGSTGTATTTTTAHHHLPLSSSLSSPGNINNNNNNGNLYQQQQHNYHHQKQNKIPSKLANSATIPFRTISFPQHHHHHPQAGLLHQPLQTKSSSSSLMILPKWHNHNSSNLSIYQHQRSMSVPPPSSSSSSNILLNSNHYPQNQNSTMLNVKKKLFKTTGSINPGVVGNVIIGNQSNIRNNHHHHYHHHHHHHYQSNILNTNIDQISSSSSSSSSKNNFIRVKKFKNRTNNEPLLLSSSSSTLKPGNKSMINKNESMETDDNCDDDHKNNNNNNNNKGQTSTIIVTTSTSESQPDSST